MKRTRAGGRRERERGDAEAWREIAGSEPDPGEARSRRALQSHSREDDKNVMRADKWDLGRVSEIVTPKYCKAACATCCRGEDG